MGKPAARITDMHVYPKRTGIVSHKDRRRLSHRVDWGWWRRWGSAPVKTGDTGSDVGAGGFIAAQQAQAQTLANAAKAGKRYCEICVR